MSLLLVSSDDLASVHTFYLDKSVQLKPGIWFSITALEDSCIVRFHPGEGTDCERRSVPVADARFTTRVPVGALYTLFYQECEQGFFFPGEQHRAYELVYVDKGCLHSVASGQDTRLLQGKAFLYAPLQWHMQYAEPDIPTSFITVSFDLDSPDSNLLTGRVLSLGNRSRHLLSAMLDEQGSGDRWENDVLQCLLRELLIQLLRSTEIDGRNREPLDSTAAIHREGGLVELAQRYISDHIGDRLRVDEVAKAINLSTPYLSALFRKHIGIAPSRYIRSAKLTEAKQRILSGNHNLTEIAGSLGYSTLPHFSRCFKEEYGISPSEYARAIR